MTDADQQTLHPGDGERARDLLARWQNGEREALAELVERNLEWVRDYVHRRLGAGLRRRAETQDMVQESMVDVLTYGPRFPVADEEQFRALLARIVENNIRDQNEWWRRRRRDMARDQTGTALQLDDKIHNATTPSQAADRSETSSWIRLALELLDARDRELIWLREWEKLSFTEIGERLDVPANTVRMRFQRALPRLAEKVVELRQGRSQ